MALMLAASLAACASKPERQSHDTVSKNDRQGSATEQERDAAPDRNSGIEKHDPCAPIYEHDERHYTAGGLYAPHLSDSAPASAIEVDKLTEPTPREEPLARYGNKSPYTVLGKPYYVLNKSRDYDQRGIASWYGQKFNGRKTSSGEIYSICEFTAAHKTLPLPSYVRVTNGRNGKSVIVRVNDRGPFHEGRIIDLSYVAAVRIGLDKTGTAPVRVELIRLGDSDNDNQLDTVFDSRPRQGIDDPSEVSLQFGSFAEKDNAKRLQEQLEAADIGNIELDKVEVKGQSLWRVQLNALENERLQEILEKIRQLGLPKPKVFSQKL